MRRRRRGPRRRGERHHRRRTRRPRPGGEERRERSLRRRRRVPSRLPILADHESHRNRPYQPRRSPPQGTPTLPNPPAAGARNETPAAETGTLKRRIKRPRKGKLCLGEKFCEANRLRRQLCWRVFADPCGDGGRRYNCRPGGGFRAWRLAGDIWGESGRGGFGDNQTGFSVRFQTPLSHVPLTTGHGSGGLEERLHHKDRRLGDSRLGQRSDLRPPPQLP
jgi:hypothetical protein